MRPALHSEVFLDVSPLFTEVSGRRDVLRTSPVNRVLGSSSRGSSRRPVKSRLSWRNYSGLREKSGGLITKVITAPATTNPAVA
jgi:hypothetical protein